MPPRCTLFGLLVLVGCGKPTPTPDPAPRPDATPASDAAKPKASPSSNRPEVVAFREKVAVYLTEARAGAKLLSLDLTVERARAKSAQMTDLYTHLPDVPPEVDTSGEVAGRLKNIHGAFTAARMMAESRAELGRLGSLEGIKKADESLAKVAADVRTMADEIEARVGR
ncbi:hypothetical protein J0H58_26045 [bacterium]|nr:hypothetical protein [bacterium]